MNARRPDADDPQSTEPRNPNDDGFVGGTAGRDEDPNATTDWAYPADDGHPRDADTSATPATRPPNGIPETGIDPAADDADAVD